MQELRMRELLGRLRLRGLHTRELRLRGIDHSNHDSAAVLPISVEKREVTEATPRILTTNKRRLVSHYRGPGVVMGGAPGSLDNQHTRLLMPIPSRHSSLIRTLHARGSPEFRTCKLTLAAITKGCPGRSIRWAASNYRSPLPRH